MHVKRFVICLILLASGQAPVCMVNRWDCSS